MPNTTTCSKCARLYEESSEEEANSPNRTCHTCFRKASGIHNYRYWVYAKAYGTTPERMLVQDRFRWPGGSMAGFILWMSAATSAFAKEHRASDMREMELRCLGPNPVFATNKTLWDAFDTWLEANGERFKPEQVPIRFFVYEADLVFYRASTGSVLTVRPHMGQYELMFKSRQGWELGLEQYTTGKSPWPHFTEQQVFEAIKTEEALATLEEAQERFWAYQQQESQRDA